MSYLKPEAYLPHRPPLLLLDEVQSITEDGASSAADPKSAIFDALRQEWESENLPAYFAMEFMAQTVGLWAGKVRLDHGAQPPKAGFILSCRRLKCTASVFDAQGIITTKVTKTLQEGNFASFDGVIMQNGREFARGTLSLYQVADDKFSEIFQKGE